MNKRIQYYGLDVVKFLLAILVAERHIIQVYFNASSKWRILWNNCLSNLAVPMFFTIAGFFLFGKMETRQTKENETRIRKYIKHILTVYLIWTLLYIPINIRNFGGYKNITKVKLLGWLHSFFFSSTIVQLWYLPSLAVACFLVWIVWERGMKLWQILAIGMVLLLCGYLVDNWYYNCRFPENLHNIVRAYRKVFITPRNGVFYGFFYVALGLWFSKTNRQMPFWLASLSFVFFVGCMYLEVRKITDAGSNTNIIFFAAPAAYFLFTIASEVNLKPRKLYTRLRNMSEWIYLSHFYFFYILSWTAKWNPIPFTSKSISAMILGAVLVFSIFMTLCAERKGGKWLRKLI